MIIKLRVAFILFSIVAQMHLRDSQSDIHNVDCVEYLDLLYLKRSLLVVTMISTFEIRSQTITNNVKEGK